MSEQDTKISLVGSVALGTGVMIGAGIFALVGQVAGLAGDWFPVAFIAGAAVAGVSSYAYARYSSVNPSAGGIAMLLKDAYGPGVVAGSPMLHIWCSFHGSRGKPGLPQGPSPHFVGAAPNAPH